MTTPNDRAAKSHSDAMSLVAVASALSNRRITGVVAMFRERKISVIRTVILGLVLIWVSIWLKGTQPVLVQDSVNVFPWVLGLFAASLAWMIAIRRGWIRESEPVDAIGVVANYTAIAILCKFAFILLITLNAVLPFITIAVGARYSRRHFIAATIASLAILIWTGPPGYWLSRPAYAVYAVALTVGLPLLIFQILSALRDVSIQALLSRDAQSRFISQMSHELRTPLQTMINVCAFIDIESLDAEQSRLIRSLDTNANVLLHRLNDVLDVAAIDGGRLHLANNAFRLDQVMSIMGDVCKPLAHAKRIALEIGADGDSGHVLLGDAGRIEQVLTNLTCNAVKFTPAGGCVEVRARCRMADGKAALSFTVTDNGVGIPDAEKQRVFQPFHQVSTGDGRKHGGVGLGLYIVKSVSDQMNGRLRITDNAGGGTQVFWDVMLPLAPQQDGPRRVTVSEALQRHRATVPAKRCLIVDDSMSNRDIIGLMLNRAGHEVVCAEDGRTALRIVAEDNLDLVFLDLHMPDVSGWEVLESMRRTSSAAVYIISADTTPTAVERAQLAGAIGYLIKPVNTHDLLAAVQAIA